MDNTTVQNSFAESTPAEENLVAAVLRDGSTFEQAREAVRAEDLRTESLRVIWEAFEALHEQSYRIDQFTVADELERAGKLESVGSGGWSGRVYLSNLRDKGDARSVMSYAANVADYAAKRNLYNLFSAGASLTLNGKRAPEIMKYAMEGLARISVFDAQDDYTAPLSVALGQAFDWSTLAASGKMPGVPTGFIDLDKILHALMPGNVYIVAGRPGTGKTALLVTIARFLAEKGFKVGVFSLEMSMMQVAQRLIAQEAGLDLEKVIAGNLSQDEWGEYADAMGRLERSGVYINDLSSISVNQIRQTSRKLKAKYGLDLVIVDYIQLAGADTSRRNSNREQEVSEISRGLKYLARELEVPVLAAAQLSREVEKRVNKRPILSDLRESGSLEQDAYAVMFVYRRDDEPEPLQNVTELIVAKHRNGVLGSVELVFRGALAKFESAATRFFNTAQGV